MAGYKTRNLEWNPESCDDLYPYSVGVQLLTESLLHERIAAGYLLLGEVLLSRNYFYAMEVFSLLTMA